MPFDQRVDRALSKLLASRTWTKAQENWLKTLAKQTKANGLVDEAVLDDPDFIFRREMGGRKRLERMFEGELLDTLRQFNETIWAT